MSRASGESRIPTARRSGLPRPAPPQLRVGAPFSLQGGSGPFSLSPTAAHDLPLPPPRPRPPHKTARFSAGDLPECGAPRRGPQRPVSSGGRLGQGEGWGGPERAWALTTAPDSAFSRQLARVTHGAQLYDDHDDDDHDDDHDDPRRARTDARLACLRDARACWEGVAAPQPPCEPRLTRESVGARVVVGGVEPGTLRYLGRTAFAAGEWAGVELDLPLGKNDGSVDGVIYFTCRSPHGIFAPLSRVAPAPHDAAPSGMPGPAPASTPAPTALPRQLTDSSPEGPECPGMRGTRRGEEGEEVAGSPGSPGDATCDDSSLGILTPDQMPDFTVTASASLGRSPSDEDVAALEDEVCEGAAAAAAAAASGEGAGCSGGRCEAKALPRWDSDPSVAALDEELFRSDVSAIIRELRSSAEATSSGGSSPSRPRPSPDTERFQRDEARLQQEDEDAHANQHQEAPAPAPGVVPRGRACPPLPEPREVPGGVDLARLPAVARRAAPLTTRLLLAAAAPGEVTPETEAAWTGGVVGVVGVGGAAMTTSAGSLDQGYQGDAECDPRSEGGTGTASSPTEDVRLFQGVIDVEADVSLGEDDHEAEHHGGGAPRGDRSARIIDGKLYHAPRELARPHDPNASEMDSSGFYSDLDPRDRDAEDESTRTDLEPVQEALGGGALHDSLLEDDSRGGASLHDSLLDEDTRADHSLDEDRSSASTLRPESKDPTLSDAHDAPEAPPPATTTLPSPGDALPPGTTIIPTTHSAAPTVIVAPATQPSSEQDAPTPPPPPQDAAPATDSPAGADAEEESARARVRTYEKPWLARPVAPRRREEPRRPLPPPPPMPKRNVQSKLKALLEAPREAPPEEVRRPRQPRKNRWDDVMTKIAEGQREAPRGPPREVKSRLMEGVLAPAATLSPQAERIRQERRERRERRQAAATAAAAAAAAAAARRPLHTRGDRKRSSASIRSNRTSRAPSLDSLPADPASFASYSRGSSVDRSEASHKSSSTASGGGASRASRDSRGLSSSSTPAPPPPPRSSSSSTPTTTTAADKKRIDTTTTTAPRRPRLDNIKATLTAKPARITQRKPTDPVKAPRSTISTGPGAPRSNTVGGHNGPAHTPTPLQDHVKRLEAEAAARAAEVRAAREEKEEVTRAVEALTVLLHHLSNTYDPFSTPRLKAEVRRLNTQLTDTKLSLDESSAALKKTAGEGGQHSRTAQQRGAGTYRTASPRP
ncbi:nascent polypeptide-associated complex subunit alpha, muscle-specific form-like isoform X1 [Scylla paramamosain]|uniref:nascent polypeptide-associated complex subunit alpha, muscle-specific form-like isoform X1 n=1 Tax=Scylla paramamosain TaxID=85552 RepID=UPI0030833DDD